VQETASTLTGVCCNSWAVNIASQGPIRAQNWNCKAVSCKNTYDCY